MWGRHQYQSISWQCIAYFSAFSRLSCKIIILIFLWSFHLPMGLSAPPVPYDNWRNQGGQIVAPCPNGFSCAVNAIGPGILQRWLTDRNGNRYIQLIVQDGNAAVEGEMKVESFVLSNNVDGMASKQTIIETGVMDYRSELNMGWADGPGEPTVSLVQHNIDTMPQGTGFNTTFSLVNNQDAAGNVSGYSYRIDQEVINSAILNGVSPSGVDRSLFTMVRLGGDMVTAGSASLSGGGMGMGGMGGMGQAQMTPPVPAIPSNPTPPPAPAPGESNANSTPGNTGGGGGGSVNWAAGNDIQVVWVGGTCPGCGFGMGGMGGGGGGGLISYQAYENLSNSGAAAMTRSYTSSSPFSWNPIFGPQPTAP